MIRQVKTRRVTISSIMGSADFKQGMADARNGAPIKDQWKSRTRKGVCSEQWSYERGRLFYFWLKSKGLDGEPIKSGRSVLRWAQEEYVKAAQEKAIL